MPQRKKETLPSRQARGSAKENTPDGITFACEALAIVYRGGIAMCAALLVGLVVLSWGLTA